MSETSGKRFVGYEYREVSVPKYLASLCADSYPCFGWEEDSNPAQGQHKSGYVNLRFKRDHKITNKAELTRLQRHFDDCIKQLEALEKSKKSQPLLAALIIGLVAAYSVLDLAFQPLQTTYAYAFNRFSIGEKDLRLRKGWLFRSTTTVPFNRVQHVDTKQNPVLRHFRLTSVVVHTAVDTHEIEALNDAEAERVVELITERVAYAKEDL